MKDKTKKYLIMTAYKGIVAAGIFILVSAIGFFAPTFIEKLSPVWTKNINIGQVKELVLSLLRELSPF